MRSIKKSILLRIRISFLCVLLFAGAIFFKLFHIQFVEHEKWFRLNEQVKLDYMQIKATRGNIYSDNGSLLATSLPFYKVAFDPCVVDADIFNEDIDSLSTLLSNYFGDKSSGKYRKMLLNARNKKRRYIILNRNQINYQTKKMMSSWPIFCRGRYGGGIIFEKTDKRYTPFANLGKRTIGYVNENNQGAGIEYSFNDILGGRDGQALFQKISGGVWKPIYDAKNVKPINGIDVQTTLDINLQDVAETSLRHAMQKHRADEGTVVVMEVQTGRIKAISNLTREKNDYYEKFNHAVGGLYEPGSTFKLVTMMALLEEGHVNIMDSVDTGDGIVQFYKNKVRDPHREGLGKITIKEAFERSSNVAMAKLLHRYFKNEPSVFLSYLDRLYLSTALNLQLVGGGHPKISRPENEDWSGITLPWMSYGYGLELTPLHILTLYNAVANEGKMVIPTFVSSIIKADKSERQYFPVDVKSKICSASTLDKLQLLLQGVVEKGTAMNLQNENYTIAGKTSTAMILENGVYAKKYVTSFVGYFPVRNPIYSAIVLIKNPKGRQQYGNDVAGPVFKEIADNIYAREIQMHSALQETKIPQAGIFPVIRAGKGNELSTLCNELGISNHFRSDKEWVRARRDGNSVSWIDNKINHNRVPNVKGMTFRDALYLLEKFEMNVQYTGAGRVLKQSLSPGEKIRKGRTIHIQLGS